MNPFSFEQLGHNPNFEIALNMPIDQLRFYCLGNELFKSICTDQEFWHERVRREYPRTIAYKTQDINWGQYYFDASIINQLLNPGITIPENLNLHQTAQKINKGNMKIVLVKYNDQIIGSILMFPSDLEIDITQRAVDLLYSIDPNINLEAIDMFYTGSNGTDFRKMAVLTILDYLTFTAYRYYSVRHPKLQNNLWNNLQVINMYDVKHHLEGWFPV